MAPTCFYGPNAEELIEKVLAETPRVVERIGARLPAGFPPQVADAILSGLSRSAKALEAMPKE